MIEFARPSRRPPSIKKILKSGENFKKCQIIDRPGVAGAVLQSPPSLINSLTE